MIPVVVLVLLAAPAIWLAIRVGRSLRDFLTMAFLTVIFAPFLAMTVTGDLSRYLPASSFASGQSGKDQIIAASAVATVLVAVIVAALAVAAAKSFWRSTHRAS